MPVCRVCGQSLADRAQTRCAFCETRLHAECWDYNGGCATYGCAGRPFYRGELPKKPAPPRLPRAGVFPAVIMAGLAAVVLIPPRSPAVTSKETDTVTVTGRTANPSGGPPVLPAVPPVPYRRRSPGLESRPPGRFAVDLSRKGLSAGASIHLKFPGGPCSTILLFKEPGPPRSLVLSLSEPRVRFQGLSWEDRGGTGWFPIGTKVLAVAGDHAYRLDSPRPFHELTITADAGCDPPALLVALTTKPPGRGVRRGTRRAVVERPSSPVALLCDEGGLAFQVPGSCLRVDPAPVREIAVDGGPLETRDIASPSTRGRCAWLERNGRILWHQQEPGLPSWALRTTALSSFVSPEWDKLLDHMWGSPPDVPGGADWAESELRLSDRFADPLLRAVQDVDVIWSVTDESIDTTLCVQADGTLLLYTLPIPRDFSVPPLILDGSHHLEVLRARLAGTSVDQECGGLPPYTEGWLGADCPGRFPPASRKRARLITLLDRAMARLLTSPVSGPRLSGGDRVLMASLEWGKRDWIEMKKGPSVRVVRIAGDEVTVEFSPAPPGLSRSRWPLGVFPEATPPTPGARYALWRVR